MELNFLDRVALAVSPSWALNRLRSRAAALAVQRHYEAASGGRRTAGWPRSGADANAANGPALHTLRAHARDLCRNNGYARRGRSRIGNGTVGWGIMAKAQLAAGAEADRLQKRWSAWAKGTSCDADGRLNFYGLQRLVMRSIVESGEVLVRRRRRRPSDGLEIPLQLQVLEADFLDTAKDGPATVNGQVTGQIIQGVEFDLIGRRVAYWLFDQHPGSGRLRPGATSFTSRRIPAEELLHVFRVDRPGQVRGVSWFAPAIVKLKDFDEYQDATLMRQKIAACFSAFVTDTDGLSAPIGKADDAQDPPIETLEPGLISYLPAGREISFANPPAVTDVSYNTATLHGIAVALDVTYEDLTGDYSQVNFSSARMGRLTFNDAVNEYRWDMLVPQMCDPVWSWAMDQLVITGDLETAPDVEWTPPPMPMIDPEKEGLAYTRAVRSGQMTPSEMIREQGKDPAAHLAEYAADLKLLDELAITLDSDARKVTQAGLAQATSSANGSSGETPTAAP